MSDAATAFVPGHVTLFFAPRHHDDSERTGSVGAGIALEDGVTVRAEPAAEPGLTLNGAPAAVESVERVLGAFEGVAGIEAETPLSLGRGFGVSGALALGTALAANEALGAGRSENELVALAHRAEVAAGTGLGDVVAQARGGVPVRTTPGAPPHGALDGVPAAGRIEYLAFGEIDTETVLGTDIAPIEAAGERALSALEDGYTLPTAFAAGRRFAREADLLVPRVGDAIDAVRESGGEAAMVMLGETVVAAGWGLSDAGYDPSVSAIHPAGATLL